jgi:hypothetical protein
MVMRSGATPQGDDGLSPSGSTGDLDGVFDRLCPRGLEERFLREMTGCLGAQALGQLDVRFVGQYLKARVVHLVQLGLDGFDDLGMPVAGVEHRDAAGEVDVALAFDIPDFCAFGALGENFVGLPQTRGQGGAATRHQRGVGFGGGGQLGVAVHGVSPGKRGVNDGLGWRGHGKCASP